MADQPQTCPTELPSSSSAKDLINGKPAAILPVVGYTALRGTLIAGGLYLAGERKPKQLFKSAVAATLMIEAWVIGWAWFQKKRAQQQQSVAQRTQQIADQAVNEVRTEWAKT